MKHKDLNELQEVGPIRSVGLWEVTNGLLSFFNYSGLSIGIPLNLLSFVFTYNHYQENIITWKVILLNFLVGLYTYGNDRLNDAVEYEHSRDKPMLSQEAESFGPVREQFRSGAELLDENDTKKIPLYNHLLKYQDLYGQLYNYSYCLYLILLLEQENGIKFHTIVFYFLYELIKISLNFRYLFYPLPIGSEIINATKISIILLVCLMYQSNLFYHDFLVLPFIMTLDLTKLYKPFKKQYPLFKPFYIGSMWTLACMVLPSVLYENNYSILQSYWSIFSPLFLMTGSSTLLDIKDIQEDKDNHIQTIPVVFGKNNARIFSVVCLLLSWYCFSNSY